MLHLRVVAPADLVAPVLEHLGALESVINVVHLPGAVRKPEGDLITCDVAREDGSIVLAALRQLGCEARGTVTVEALEASLSRAADDAEEHAVGSAADAVVWEAVSAQTSESAELSFSYLLFMTLAALIAAVGVLTDSVVLIIGAMVVGPEFGPLAGLCVALVQRRYALAGRSASALLIGFGVGVVAAAAFTALLVAAGLAPIVPAASHPQTLFISRPDAYAVIIALLAGVAGMFSLTTSKPGALIGVFISVTTIPAAANLGVAAAYQQAAEARGAAVQLAVNLATMIIAGVATLLVQRLAFRRRSEALQRRAPGRPKGTGRSA